MTILWCGGEDIDFPNGIVPTISGHNNAEGYSRLNTALSCHTVGSFVKSTVFPGGAVTSAWMMAYIYNECTVDTLTCGLGFGKSGTNKGIFLGLTYAGLIKIYKYDGASATLLATSANPFNTYSSTPKRLDMRVSNYGADATVDMYIDNVLAVTYTGDITVAGMTDFDSVYIGCPGSNSRLYASEIVVADEDTRTMRLKTLVPTSDGTTTDMTGSYADVDETAINDADVNYTDTAGVDQQFNVSDLPAGTFAIKAVKIACRACKSEDASIDKLALGYNSGGTVAVGADQALTTAWATCESLDNVNPVTGNAWLQSEMNALQLNVRSAT